MRNILKTVSLNLKTQVLTEPMSLFMMDFTQNGFFNAYSLLMSIFQLNI